MTPERTLRSGQCVEVIALSYPVGALSTGISQRHIKCRGLGKRGLLEHNHIPQFMGDCWAVLHDDGSRGCYMFNELAVIEQAQQPREYTPEEIREKLLDQIWVTINYWRTQKVTGDRYEGLAFSILSVLDGSTAALPAFQIVPAPHESDREYCKTYGENWFPQSSSNANDIGPLHEHFHQVGRKNGWIK